MPTFMAFKGGKKMCEILGSNPENLKVSVRPPRRCTDGQQQFDLPRFSSTATRSVSRRSGSPCGAVHNATAPPHIATHFVARYTCPRHDTLSTVSVRRRHRYAHIHAQEHAALGLGAGRPSNLSCCFRVLSVDVNAYILISLFCCERCVLHDMVRTHV